MRVSLLLLLLLLEANRSSVGLVQLYKGWPCMAALLSGGAQLGTRACVECCYASRVVESMACAVSACMWLLVYSCRLAVVQARLFPGLGLGTGKQECPRCSVLMCCLAGPVWGALRVRHLVY